MLPRRHEHSCYCCGLKHFLAWSPCLVVIHTLTSKENEWPQFSRIFFTQTKIQHSANSLKFVTQPTNDYFCNIFIFLSSEFHERENEANISGVGQTKYWVCFSFVSLLHRWGQEYLCNTLVVLSSCISLFNWNYFKPLSTSDKYEFGRKVQLSTEKCLCNFVTFLLITKG